MDTSTFDVKPDILRNVGRAIAPGDVPIELQFGNEGHAEFVIKHLLVLGRANHTSTHDLNVLDSLLHRHVPAAETVSRRHAMIERRGTCLYLSDLGSTNGTWLNGLRLQAGQMYRLASGDIIALGALNCRILF